MASRFSPSQGQGKVASLFQKCLQRTGDLVELCSVVMNPLVGGMHSLVGRTRWWDALVDGTHSVVGRTRWWDAPIAARTTLASRSGLSHVRVGVTAAENKSGPSESL